MAINKCIKLVKCGKCPYCIKGITCEYLPRIVNKNDDCHHGLTVAEVEPTNALK